MSRVRSSSRASFSLSSTPTDLEKEEPLTVRVRLEVPDVLEKEERLRVGEEVVSSKRKRATRINTSGASTSHSRRRSRESEEIAVLKQKLAFFEENEWRMEQNRDHMKQNWDHMMTNWDRMMTNYDRVMTVMEQMRDTQQGMIGLLFAQQQQLMQQLQPLQPAAAATPQPKPRTAMEQIRETQQGMIGLLSAQQQQLMQQLQPLQPAAAATPQPQPQPGQRTEEDEGETNSADNLM